MDTDTRGELLLLKRRLENWETKDRCRRLRRIRVVGLLALALVTLGQVQIQNADFEVHENPDGGAAGSDSYQLKLVGRVSGPADRSIILQNVAEAGSDDYRFSIKNNGGTELMSADDDGGVTVGALDGGLAGSLILVDSDGSSPESVTIGPPTGANLTTSYSLTLPADDGTDGEFLRTDGSGNLSWSGAIGQATATADTTTTSTSDVLINSMTLTPGAGDYMVWFSSSVENDSANDYSIASLYVGGSQVAHTEREAFTESSILDTSMPIAFQAYVTSVGASDAIEVRWRVTGGTATMHERTLTIMKR